MPGGIVLFNQLKNMYQSTLNTIPDWLNMCRLARSQRNNKKCKIENLNYTKESKLKKKQIENQISGFIFIYK